MSFERRDVDRKILSILKVLQKQQDPTGGRLIAHQLKDHGVALSERAVRYHLKIMDERGLTSLMGTLLAAGDICAGTWANKKGQETSLPISSNHQ